MTSFITMPCSQRGKTSPSFLAAIVLVFVVLGGYFGWRALRPNPFKQSEQVVRQSRRELSASVRDFDQAVRAVMEKPGLSPAQRMGEIEKEAASAKKGIDEYIDDARDRLADIETPLKTHRNRDDRLNGNGTDAREMIDRRVEEKREQLKGS